MTVEEIARIYHEVNRAYCAAIGDDSQVSWEDAPEWQKESCRNGVKFVVERGFCHSEDQHNAWMSEKLRAGWRYGSEKNVATLTHPCLLPYNELSRQQKLKDDLFRAIVRGLKPPDIDEMLGPTGSADCPVDDAVEQGGDRL